MPRIVITKKRARDTSTTDVYNLVGGESMLDTSASPVVSPMRPTTPVGNVSTTVVTSPAMLVPSPQASASFVVDSPLLLGGGIMSGDAEFARAARAAARMPEDPPIDTYMAFLREFDLRPSEADELLDDAAEQRRCSTTFVNSWLSATDEDTEGASVADASASMPDADIEAALEALHCRWKDSDREVLIGDDETDVDGLIVLLNRIGADSMVLEGATRRTYIFERSQYGARPLHCTVVPDADPVETLPPECMTTAHEKDAPSNVHDAVASTTATPEEISPSDEQVHHLLQLGEPSLCVRAVKPERVLQVMREYSALASLSDLHPMHAKAMTGKTTALQLLVLTTLSDAPPYHGARGILAYTCSRRGQVTLVHVLAQYRRRGYASVLAQTVKLQLHHGCSLTVDTPISTALCAVKLWLSAGFMCDEELLQCTLTDDAAYVGNRSVRLTFTWSLKQDRDVHRMYIQRVADVQPELLSTCKRLLG